VQYNGLGGRENVVELHLVHRRNALQRLFGKPAGKTAAACAARKFNLLTGVERFFLLVGQLVGFHNDRAVIGTFNIIFFSL
jgi:hypothetical protein